MKDLMIDIETMGNRFDAPILSIGAVYFDIESGTTGASFYKRVDPSDAFNYGKPHGDTLRWWMSQGDEARKSAMSGKDKLADTLIALAEFTLPKVSVWGNGPSFDMTIIEHGMARCGVKVPWDFWNINCCRTIKRIASAQGWTMPVRAGVHHDALDDSRYQAVWVSSAWKFIGGKRTRQIEEDLL